MLQRPPRRAARALVTLVAVIGLLAGCRVQQVSGRATVVPTAAPAVTSAPTPAGGPTPKAATGEPTPSSAATGTSAATLTAPALAASPTPQATATAMPPLAASTSIPTAQAAATPGAAAPACATSPIRGFGLVWESHPEVPGLVGCPTGSETATGVVFQRFEHGWMVQVSAPAQGQAGPKLVYVLFSDTNSVEAVPDTWVAGTDPISTGQTPPAGLVEPQRDFGKVWRDVPNVRGRLGWAIAPERGANGAWQPFQHGQMIWTPDPKQVFVVGQQAPASAAPNAWRLYPDLFVG